MAIGKSGDGGIDGDCQMHLPYEYVQSIEHRLILIDGIKPATLMFEHNVGVNTKNVFEIKDIDSGYFEQA